MKKNSWEESMKEETHRKEKKNIKYLFFCISLLLKPSKGK